MNESKRDGECDSDCYLEVISYNPETRVWVVKWVHSHSTDDCVDGFPLGEKVLVTKQRLKSMNGVRILGCKKEDR